jgi:hypothetical protein
VSDTSLGEVRAKTLARSKVYFAAMDVPGLDWTPVKIGFGKRPDHRLSHIRIGSPFPVDFIGTIPGARLTERYLHQRFAAERVRGEWFRQTPEIRTIALTTTLPFEDSHDFRAAALEGALCMGHTHHAEASRVAGFDVREYLTSLSEEVRAILLYQLGMKYTPPPVERPPSPKITVHDEKRHYESRTMLGAFDVVEGKRAA